MKVAVVGNLAGVARDIVIGLRQAGVAADLFLEKHELAVMRQDAVGLGHLAGASLYVLDRDYNLSGWPGLATMAALHLPVAARLTGYDIIHVHTGSLAGSPVLRGLFVHLGLRPYLAFATGSDFREVARLDTGKRGERMRTFLRRAADILLLNLDMVGFKDAMGFSRASFFPFVIDSRRFSPAASEGRGDGNAGRLECFMMSNLDFGVADNTPGRNSMKHNDRVLHALARFAAEDPGVHLTLLDRGPDRAEARRLVEELGLEPFVTFSPPLSQMERIAHIAASDVVFDQFHLGAFGLGALEAMSMGKAVVTSVDADAFAACYGETALPCQGARTVEDIHEALRRLRSNAPRQALSRQAREFILRHHAPDVVIPRLIALYERHVRSGKRNA